MKGWSSPAGGLSLIIIQANASLYDAKKLVSLHGESQTKEPDS